MSFQAFALGGASELVREWPLPRPEDLAAAVRDAGEEDEEGAGEVNRKDTDTDKDKDKDKSTGKESTAGLSAAAAAVLRADAALQLLDAVACESGMGELDGAALTAVRSAYKTQSAFQRHLCEF